MENNKVLMGSIIFVFASFIGMMVLFVYERYEGGKTGGPGDWVVGVMNLVLPRLGLVPTRYRCLTERSY